MKAGEVVLLLTKDESYLIEVGNKDFNTKSGIIKSKSLLKTKFGEKIKTHLGKEFRVVKPNITDTLKKAKRGPQIIMPKDAALILAYTGVGPESRVVDIGTGSAFLAIFLANYLSKGKVVTYEKDKRFFEIAKENIKLSGLKNIELKKKDAIRGIKEKNVDLITVDIQKAEKVIKHAYTALKAGGYLVIYSPTVEELLRVNKELRKKDFCEVKTVENIVREWQVERTTRPKTYGLLHTGFLTFARKFK